VTSSGSRGSRPGGAAGGAKPPTLKDVAQLAQVSPATVSVVLNRSPVADAIPEETKGRVRAAARQLGYRPNYMARALRQKRSHSIGVLVPEIAEGFSPAVMAGVEDHLLDEGYFYLVASHRWQPDLLEEYLQMLSDRAVDGFLLLNTPLTHPPSLPTCTVAGHHRFEGVTNVILDHERAAGLALGHLAELGHERLAVFRGHPHTADGEVRWQSIGKSARELGLEIRPENVVQLPGVPPGKVLSAEEGYREGYVLGQKLLAQGGGFTTLFAFNDISAIGAIRAFLDAGLRVPDDVSVVGFDDIMSAAFLNPSLTTVRQPLRQMGETAARILLERLGGRDDHEDFVTVAPELVVRGSTGPPPGRRSDRGRTAQPLAARGES
jgi:DNA-binding LacI/PurR family transcriptional regulator